MNAWKLCAPVKCVYCCYICECNESSLEQLRCSATFGIVTKTFVQCRWLEEELARRYRDAAPATLALLQERCEGVAAELVAAESRLQAAEDVTSLRRAGDRLNDLLQIMCWCQDLR